MKSEVLPEAETDWAHRDWTLVMVSNNGTLEMDNVQEFQPGVVGQRTGMSDGWGATSWSYDLRGRLTRETCHVAGVGAFITVADRGGYNTPAGRTCSAASQFVIVSTGRVLS